MVNKTNPPLPHIIKTADGSDTLFVPELNEHYHSTFGAIQESRHIFIEAGLNFTCHVSPLNRHPASAPPTLNILEIGFGTGLNALLTCIEAQKHELHIVYTSIEAFPLNKGIWQNLNYTAQPGISDYTDTFEKLHTAKWNRKEIITSNFTIHKIHEKLEIFNPQEASFNLVYFDAFGPEKQPYLWTIEIFQKIFYSLHKQGTLVTYSVKGDVVRAIKTAGFSIEKIPGPPGKRHILRARRQ